jgi:dihydropteroate synthase
MGILNVTPDSFSGDGLLKAAGRDAGRDADSASHADPTSAAVALAQAMVADGADLLDVGGASSRPGHAPLTAADEIARVVPVIRAIAQALPGTPISVDTTSPAVAEAALAAGAHLLNDVWGVADDDALMRVAAEHGVPIVLMHNREAARYRNLMAEVVADLWRALDRALDAGLPWEHLVIDPGFGFGKTPEHNLALLAGLDDLRVLRRPLLLGTSRKSTLGKLLDLPPDQRVEVTAASTVLGVMAGADIVRVHDVAANVRAARVADAVRRGWRPAGWNTGSGA